MRPAGLLAGWLVLLQLAAPAQTPSSLGLLGRWRGLVGRVEYRHDQADEKVSRARYDENHVLAPTAQSMNTFSLSMYYTFF